jgi:anti-sigma factor RsiW
MNRKRIEQELSLHLDGRLPSGRREKLLAHLADDEEAARLWEEMQAAQEQALRLPGHEVSREFHESLWQRIRSGEGTPEAVFREPVPMATRLRYLATGAAAAAALIACFHFLFRSEEATPPAEQNVATVDARPDDTQDPAARASFALAPIAPVNPLTVARASQEGAIDGVQQLRRRLPEIEERIEVVEPRQLVVELDPLLDRVRGSADLMRWMHEERIIEMPGRLQAALELATRSVERMEEANMRNDARMLWIAVQDLKELDPDRLRADFGVVCCKDPEEFLLRFREHVVHNRNAGRALRIEVLQAAPVGTFGFPFGAVPEGGFWSSTETGQSFQMWIREPDAPQAHVRVQVESRSEADQRR